MKPHPFHRLHELRLENDQHRELMNEMRPRFDALRTRHEDGTAPKAVTSFNLFQTPETLAARMAALLDLSPHHTLLEPSAGLGRLLRAALATVAPDTVTACDISKECLEAIYNNPEFENVEIAQGDFLEKQLGKYDRIIMNPPFKMRRDIKHVLHAMGHLAPGGRLVGLCLDGYKREESLRHLCTTWEPIPAGTFKAEGTQVPTILFTINN